jgi:peptidoglycan-N-acetylglucosamine deacetylase
VAPLRRIALQAAALAVGLGVIGFAAYELFEQPTNQIFGRTITQGPTNERIIALTYDDGPNPPYTDKILDVLESEHVHATFFLVGRAVQAYPGVVEREVRDGDAVGNHTWDHRHLIVMTRSQVRTSLSKTDAAIFAASRQHTYLMRPPFGARDWIVMQVARKMGYTVVMWSVPLARDWEYPPAQVIAQRILTHVSDGSIMVLHDGNRGQLCGPDHLAQHTCDRSSDIEATRIIIDRLKSQGYRFVTIPELVALRKTPTHTGAPDSE